MSMVSYYFGYRRNTDHHGSEEDGHPTCKTCLRKVAVKGDNALNMIAYLAAHPPSLFVKFKVKLRLS